MSAGRWDGKGKLSFGKSGDVYEGGFRRGVFSGPGVYRYKSGGSYEGDYKVRSACAILVNPCHVRDAPQSNNRHGIGKRVFASGAIYEGQFIKVRGFFVSPVVAPRSSSVYVPGYHAGGRGLQIGFWKRVLRIL